MSKPYEWMVGLRYTRSGKRAGRSGFVSFISAISLAGIALGVGAVIVVLSIMNGFQKDVMDRMLSVLAHIEVFETSGSMPDWQRAASIAMKNPEVRGAAPYVQTEAMLMRGKAMRPTVVRGILPSEEGKVSDVARQVKRGSMAALEPGQFNIVLGYALAQSLGVDLGDKVTMALAQGQVTPAGILPRVRTFRVVGILESGHPQFDAAFAFVRLEDAQRLQRLDGPSGLRLRIADMHRAPEVAAELRKQFGPEVEVRDWPKLNANWFAATQIEKKMMFIVLALIVTVAAFNLVSSLVMTVTDKQADIAILRTLGSSPRSIMKIFMVQGALIGVSGTLIGLVGGVLVALNIDVIVPFIEHLLGVQFLAKDIYLNTAIPSELRWPDVSVIGVMTVLLAFGATLYPSWTASRVKPAEALRYE
ncbi:lipoprotein-releasing ABC transporter permease subunit [Massilia arenosa]|uniref:Lipoprotein-releasing ABC transporter permease subunit n=1 Tax=Zemynaea arenosa TaxID=2561931 RepID=A0A4Y9SFY5_9BURK|nr:lipoprotein-releasing ABC transporter permease subunit [Massilia arenosa]TFW19025.1 lipoprotein-releasing ABC transporter permease subunit [Massilia arenosa]